ncbi:MAG: hypothetical protein ACOCVJ_01180 [Verrucomicrobiota bacterium]
MRSANLTKHRPFLKTFAAAVLFAGLAAPSAAQIDETPDFAPFLLDKRVEREDYNLRLGPAMIDIIGTFGIEYDDNINTSETDPISDWILQPGVSFGLKWQMTEFNELDVNLGLEYWHYLSEDELNDSSNQIALTPNTEVSFRVLVGDVIFRVYDRLQYSFDSADAVEVDANGKPTDRDPTAFTRWNNVIGLQSEWFIGENVFSGQLSREDVYSPEDEFEYVNRTEYKIALNAERALAANFLVGLGTSYAVFDYDEEVNNDGDVWSVGPYFDWKITEYVGLYAGVAYNDRSFDDDGLTDDTPFGDSSDDEDITWTVRLSHVLNEVFNHQVEWYRSTDVSNTANFNRLDGLRYTFAYNINPRVRLDGAAAYEENESSGGLLNDDFDRWLAGISTEIVLGPRLTADISYRYIDKDSTAELQSYEQNQFRVFFEYDF